MIGDLVCCKRGDNDSELYFSALISLPVQTARGGTMLCTRSTKPKGFGTCPSLATYATLSGGKVTELRSLTLQYEPIPDPLTHVRLFGSVKYRQTTLLLTDADTMT